VSSTGICQLIISFAALFAFLITGVASLVRGDELIAAALKASAASVSIVIVLRFFSGLLQGVWINSLSNVDSAAVRDQSDAASHIR